MEKNINLSAPDLNAVLKKFQLTHEKSLKSSLYTINAAEHGHKNLWLLKPTGFNRGIGIHVFNSVQDLVNILWTHYRIKLNAKSDFPYDIHQLL